MSPTRRDIIRAAGALPLALSLSHAIRPVEPALAATRTLTDVIETDVPYGKGAGALFGCLMAAWNEWPPRERRAFLNSLEQEYPAMSGYIVTDLDRRGGVR